MLSVAVQTSCEQVARMLERKLCLPRLEDFGLVHPEFGFLSNSDELGNALRLSLNDSSGGVRKISDSPSLEYRCRFHYCTVSFRMPEHHIKRLMKAALEWTVGSFIESALKKTTVSDVEDFGLFHNKSKSKCHTTRTLESYGVREKDKLILKRIHVRALVLLESGAHLTLLDDPQVKVSELLARVLTQVQRKVTLSNPKEYCLYFPAPKNSPAGSNALGGLVLQEQRKFASYNLSRHDMLHFLPRPKVAVFNEDAIQMQITFPSMNLTRFFSLSSAMTVGAVVKLFCDSTGCGDAGTFGLFQNKDEKHIPPMTQLRHCNLPSEVELVLKRITSRKPRLGVRGRLRPGTNGKSSFGKDPKLLPTVQDQGYQVPEVLATLRRCLLKHNGLAEEGLFRLAGEEGHMEDLKEQLDTGRFEDTDSNVEISTIIKRWYGHLPNRVLKPLGKSEIQRAAHSPEDAHAVVSKMPDPERSLLLWFGKLLAQVAANEEVNKMSPSNLAIVVSPVLADLPLENPFIALDLTRQATLFVKQLISYQLAHLSDSTV